MAGIFDRLQQRLNIIKEDKPAGPNGLAVLPSNQQKVMRLFFQEGPLKRSTLCEAIDGLPPADRQDITDLDTTLSALVEQNWLVRYGSGEFTSYRLNQHAAAGAKRQADIWSALDMRLASRRSA